MVHFPPMGKSIYPPGATFCRTCGYCLHGLPENRCAECGHAFDPADPTTFLARPRRVGVKRTIKIAVPVILVLALAYGGLLGWLYVGWRAEAGARALPTGPEEELKTRSVLPAALSHLLLGDCRQWQDRVDELRLWGHTLSSSDVRSIAVCRTLRVLRLFAVHLKTADVVELCQPGELEELYLECADLHMGDLAPLGRLVHLKKLSVSGNKAVGDENLAAIGKLKELRLLSFDGTTVADESLAHLSELGHLETLSLAGCSNLTDAAVPHLSRLSGLKHLWLTETDLTPDAIDQLEKNLPGCNVYGP